jgi:hypothetical protein
MLKMRYALIAVLLVGRCAAAPALTTIQDTLYKADGTRFDGVAQIAWKSFQAADGSEVPQQTINVQVTAGNLRVALVPTKNAARPTSYTVKFNSDGRTQFVEYWSVPPSPTTLRLRDVRVSQQAGAIEGGTPTTILDVTGLRAELDARSIKAPAMSVPAQPSSTSPARSMGRWEMPATVFASTARPDHADPEEDWSLSTGRHRRERLTVLTRTSL